VDVLRQYLAGVLPEGPWLYPEDQIADLPMRMIAAEMTREKLTLRLHQELPYQMTVETENWEERPDGSARVDQLIYVVRDGHKGIVLGHKGETIKSVSKAARAELEEFLGRRVHLFLQVKVRPKWGWISKMGTIDPFAILAAEPCAYYSSGLSILGQMKRRVSCPV
jgi:GTP-binding protein Era